MDAVLTGDSGETPLPRVLQQIDHYFESEVDWETVLQRTDIEGFVRHLAQPDVDLETLETAWETLRFLEWYVEHLGPEIDGLETMQAYHLSELVTDFTDRKILGRIGVTERITMAQVIRDYFQYLAAQGAVDPASAARIRDAYALMTSTPGLLVRIERPEPIGGETFSATINRGQEILYTYNDYWVTLVCLRDYDGLWSRMREAAYSVPDQAAKLALIDHLEGLENHRVEGLRNLLGIRQPAPAELQRARRFFRRDAVSAQRAW